MGKRANIHLVMGDESLIVNAMEIDSLTVSGGRTFLIVTDQADMMRAFDMERVAMIVQQKK